MTPDITIKSLQDEIFDLKAEIVELSAAVSSLSNRTATDRRPGSASTERGTRSGHGTATEHQGMLMATILGAGLLGIALARLIWRRAGVFRTR
jgi:hypothetical protein